MNESVSTARIVAPLSSFSELEPLARAGADEIYCGALPPQWTADYGSSDTLTRRQGTVANVASTDELMEIARSAPLAGVRSALTLNVRYTREQRANVIALAEQWGRAGGDAVIVSDLALLLALNERGVRGVRHLSILADAANHRAIAFFRRLGVTRVVFPRWLTIQGMKEAARHDPACQYGAIVLNDRCEFIDGMCGFYHGTAYPAGAATHFACAAASPDSMPRIACHDPAYAGHGCQLPFCTSSGQAVVHQPRDDARRPACAACALPRLLRAGVHHLKISGRGLPTALKLRAVRYMRTALDAINTCDDVADRTAQLRDSYCRTFGTPCHDGTSCYYAGAGLP
ncbi:MAG TPA: U32 family peptidase [Thermoanaerobaculia bacterium]